MIDVGLLASILIAALAPRLVARLIPTPGGGAVSGDRLMYAGLAGLVAGRLAFVVLDDPGSFARLRDLMIIRSGVEFWPGVAVGAGLYALWSRRSGRSAADSLSLGAPLFLVGYGAYEASCVLREGCFGPPSGVGLTPPGFAGPVFPVAWAVAAVTVLSAVVLRRHRHDGWHGVLVALLVLASTRAVAGFFLPRVGAALSRPHIESLVAAGAALALHLGVGALGRHTTSSRTSSTNPAILTDPDPWKGP